MSTGCLKGYKSSEQRDHSIPVGYNISHQFHAGHKSNTAAS